jgi:molybdate transport system permease protein
MDWSALGLSLELAAWTTVILVPMGVLTGRALAARRFVAKSVIEALIALPLVLPPTVLGFYLLVAFGGASPLGRAYEALVGQPLVFTFQGLLVASLVFNLPFAVQPIQRAFESLPRDIREAAWCCDMSPWHTFRSIEFPLVWTGVLSAMVLTFAHTLGEFGVVLMVGGNIPGETQTVAIAIYDRVQALQEQQAALMSAILLGFSFVTITFIYLLNSRAQHHHGRH